MYSSGKKLSGLNPAGVGRTGDWKKLWSGNNLESYDVVVVGAGPGGCTAARYAALKGAKVLLVGVAYKRNIDDLRESPALKVAHLLQGSGAVLSYHDPQIPTVRSEGFDMDSLPLTPETLAEADLVIITTAHTAVDYETLVRHARLVFDTRNATAGIPAENVTRLGAG